MLAARGSFLAATLCAGGVKGLLLLLLMLCERGPPAAVAEQVLLLEAVGFATTRHAAAADVMRVATHGVVTGDAACGGEAKARLLVPVPQAGAGCLCQ